MAALQRQSGGCSDSIDRLLDGGFKYFLFSPLLGEMIQFHHSGFRFEGHDSVAKTTTILRKVINQSAKRFSDFPLFVGQQKAGSISLGKTLPAGHIRGSRPLVAIQALKNLASVVLHGRSHALSLWDTPF